MATFLSLFHTVSLSALNTQTSSVWTSSTWHDAEHSLRVHSLMMDLFGRGELSLLGGGDEVAISGISWSTSQLPDDVYPASGLALAAAYHDIKTRLASLERENSSIKLKLKQYEYKFPMIHVSGEERNLCCSCELTITDAGGIQTETTNLQLRVNSLTQELQKTKEREEQLEDVIQAYKKIHLEKNNMQRDLDKMTSLAEQHVKRICSLESALRQRESSIQNLSTQIRHNDAHKVRTHDNLLVPREGRGPTLQSSRSLDALSDMKLQRLEAELEGALNQAEGACQRESELRVKLQKLQQEVAQLQEAQRQSQELKSHCEHCDVEWIKKAGDEQVNLALAYTELTEELGRVRSLSAKQSDLLRQATQEHVSNSPPAPQRLSPTSPNHLRHHPLSSERLLSSLSPPLSPNTGPASYSHQPTSSLLRAKFQGRRSYSEVSDPSLLQRAPARLVRDPVSTLPKPRSLLGDSRSYGQSKRQLRAGPVELVRPASAHGGGGDRIGEVVVAERAGGGSLSSSPHHRPLELGFPVAAKVHHFCHLDDRPEPTPLVTPPQSSDEDEELGPYLSTAPSPLRTLGTIGIGSTTLREPPHHLPFPSARKQPQHPSHSAPEGPVTLSCRLPADINAERAQSWPSINLWMESEESAVRSCPLCHLTFPTGYPDDALIKHIDSHLENSKI
ncbi:TANK-binding kinase 1-binding protein 1-like isoform X2 [Synchiropus splendidus]|uniref:TANK-binding kinase 1-binding protein 1-like isoform X2 n=2 Tax=Synchiropus splendidus TaxID=270530 RepID=UPI00237D7879|nr:TANK-binding kinase 1-binding protein 1-like isoform X2 [Synchiropus splendidus]